MAPGGRFAFHKTLAARARVARGGIGRAFVATVVFASIVLGCAISTPPETFYTLGAAIDAPTTLSNTSNASTTGSVSPNAATARPAKIAVLIEPARVPQLVDRPQLVISINDAQVQPLEQQRWAEPLTAQIPRVLALDLARVLPSMRVSTNEDVLDGADPSNGYRVSLDVQRFETKPGDSASIELAWTIRRSGGDVIASGRERVREPIRETSAAPGYDGAVRAHNRALATVGRTIAAALRPVAGAGN